jgi:mycothiol system anti-sigma-R factor
MNCRDVLVRLDQFVDRELSPDEVLEVRQHLDDCPPCQHIYHYEARVRRLVRHACSELAPAALRARILQQKQ